MGSWEKLGKHGRAVNVSGKMLPRLLKLTTLGSVPGSKVTHLKHFSCKGGLSLTLLIGSLYLLVNRALESCRSRLASTH